MCAAVKWRASLSGEFVSFGEEPTAKPDDVSAVQSVARCLA
jgi:hypothetical protein